VTPPAPAPPSFPDPNLIAPLVQETVLIILALIVGAIIAVRVLGPIARAVARRLEGKIGDPELRADIDQVHERLNDLEQTRTRVTELEERVEFAERLLAQGRDRDLLQRGGPGA
jgi:hypothetical protein